MRNKDFIKDWVRNPSKEGTANNVWACYNKLYSYSTCICQAYQEVFYFNITKYSSTTSKHQTYLRRALDYYNREVREIDNVERNKSKLIEHI